MHLMTEDYTISWINLRIGIAMRCSISPTLFVMAMELIFDALHNWTEKTHKQATITTIPIKAFMNDMTSLERCESNAIGHQQGECATPVGQNESEFSKIKKPHIVKRQSGFNSNIYHSQ